MRARILLTEVKIAERFSDDEIEMFFDDYAAHYEKQAHDQEQQIGVDAASLLELTANGYAYCKDKISNINNKEKLDRINEKQRKFGQKAYNLRFQKGDFGQALKDAELFELDRSLVRTAAKEYIKQLILSKKEKGELENPEGLTELRKKVLMRIIESNKKIALKLADKFKIEDEEILEKLTQI